MNNWICGVDESGRGPLAGPVFAACVILDPQHRIEGLSVREIDRLNILQASLLAMKRAVEGLSFEPSRVLVDGTHSPRLKYPVTTIIRGDSLVPEISAASILAKTARDAEMGALHQRFPLYGFDRHKGYCTEQHLAALRIHGASEVHRRSFAPVRELMVDCKLF
jgi:ribonuclease HII